MNEQTTTLLNEISKNAGMGKNTLHQLMGITQDTPLRKNLKKQLDLYEDLSRRAHAMLEVKGEHAKEQSPMAKMSASVGITLQTITDRSARNIAEMVIQGSHMGATDMEKAMKDSPQAENGAVALAQRLQQAENEYATELQSFL